MKNERLISLIEKEKIYEPVLKKITEGYGSQNDTYLRILSLTKKQIEIKNQKEISIFTEIAAEKNVLFEEIAKRNEYLIKSKSDMVKALGIDEFTISALKSTLDSKVTDSLSEILFKLSESIMELEKTEKKNEENLKKILKLS